VADYVEIFLALKNARKFISDADKSGRAVEGVGKSAQKGSKAASKSWRNMTQVIGGTAVFAAAGVYMKHATQDAVDLHEEINKGQVVFGRSAADIEHWSESSATSLGMTRVEALQATGIFGNMLVPMGYARKRAASMSKGLVKLSADLASFNNASPEETMQALRSGLAGQVRPLRRFGVFLDQARIKAVAVSTGIVKATKNTGLIKVAQLRAEVAQRKYTKAVAKHGKQSTQGLQALATWRSAQQRVAKAVQGSVPQLTAAQKATAAYRIIQMDTKDAQGDFARTSDAMANRQRILRAQFGNLSEELGTKTLPIMLKVAGVLVEVMKHTNLLKAALLVIIPLFVTYQVMIFAVTAAETLFNVQLSITQVLITGGVVLAIFALIAVGYLLIKHWGTVKKVAAQVWGAILKGARFVWQWLKRNWPYILGVLVGPFGLAVVAVVKHWDKIKAGVRKLADYVIKQFQRVVDFVKSIPSKIGSPFKKALGGVGGFASKLNPFGGQHGGVVPRASRVLVGERGPEMLTLPTGAKITPLPFSGSAALAGGGEAVIHTHVYVDRREIARAVGRYTSDKLARR